MRRVRRRAALALGRVGLPAAIPTLQQALQDQEPEVRQMAAFALGLIGDRTAREALVMALEQRRPAAGLVHHSDRGVQYASHDYTQLLQAHVAPELQMLDLAVQAAQAS